MHEDEDFVDLERLEAEQESEDIEAEESFLGPCDADAGDR
jgi:hypothetical protein